MSYNANSKILLANSRRKKYRKMRHAFEEKMKISNSLFGQEQKAIKLARRLQEQNE